MRKILLIALLLLNVTFAQSAFDELDEIEASSNHYTAITQETNSDKIDEKELDAIQPSAGFEELDSSVKNEMKEPSSF